MKGLRACPGPPLRSAGTRGRVLLRLRHLLLQPLHVGRQPPGDKRHQLEAEFRILVIELVDRALVDGEHGAGADAARRVRAPPVGREEGDLAEHVTRLDEDPDLDDLDAALGQEVQVVRLVALVEQHVAGLALGAHHVGLEPDARAFGGGGLHALGQPDHLDRPEDVDRQQDSVEQQHRYRRVQDPVDDEADVAADAEPAQRNHRLDEGADDHQARRDEHRNDGDDLLGRRQHRLQAGGGDGDDL